MQVGKLVCVGGFISCLATLLVSRVIKFESPIWAGPIEELIKGGVMLLFIRNPRYHYKLNGLLVGASIGVGFAIIETSRQIALAHLARIGVPFAIFEITAGYDVHLHSINFEFIMFIRALAAPLCHVLYSSLVGYALWEARANGIFTFEALVKGKTLRLIALAIVLHMFWNSNFLLNDLSLIITNFLLNKLIIKCIIVAIIGYRSVIYLLQDCIKEIRLKKQMIE